MAVRLVGAAEMMRDRIYVEHGRMRGGTTSPASFYLRQVLGRDVTVALYIGPIRAVQKPILQLLHRPTAGVSRLREGRRPTSWTRAPRSDNEALALRA